MAAHGLLCQLSFSYSWEKLQLGSAGPEHSIFTSTIKSSLLQVPLLTLLHFICCHFELQKFNSALCPCANFNTIKPIAAPITSKNKKWKWMLYNCKKETSQWSHALQYIPEFHIFPLNYFFSLPLLLKF